MADYVCSKCGAPAGSDARMGSLDVYLTCGCDSRGTWVNDGRGGYWSTNAKPVDSQEYYERNPDYRWGGSTGGYRG